MGGGAVDVIGMRSMYPSPPLTSSRPPACLFLPLILPPSLPWSIRLETHGPLGTLIIGFGLCAFYIALIWLNTLLGVFLTPLFIIPGTWLLEWLQSRRRGEQKARR
jgi:hypothetical protein